MEFYNDMENISNFRNGTMTLMREQPADAPLIISADSFPLEMKRLDNELLDDLQKLIDGEMTGSTPTKEQHDLFEKMHNERYIGLYMTNDEVLPLFNKRIQRLMKWDYETHSYHQYGVPAEWKVYVGGDDMSQIINCAGCGKELPMGEAFASLEIHSKVGFGYGVCKECNDKEHERKDRGEADDLP